MSPKHPFSPFLQKICKGLQKRNGYNVLNVSALQPFFVFLRFCILFLNVLFFQKTQGNYFPLEFFAEIKKLPKFALCLDCQKQFVPLIPGLFN